MRKRFKNSDEEFNNLSKENGTGQQVDQLMRKMNENKRKNKMLVIDLSRTNIRNATSRLDISNDIMRVRPGMIIGGQLEEMAGN